MNYVSIAVSRTVKLLTVLAFGAALAGCMITSKEALVSEDEAVTPLPASVFLFGYGDDAGAYKLSEDPPIPLVLNNKTYASADNSINVRFVPLDAPDMYLLAMVGPDGTTYGTAVYRNNILTANLIVGDSDLKAVIEAEKASGKATPEILADIAEQDGAIMVTKRATVDHLIAMSREGRLTLGGLVMFAAESADAKPPARLVADGDFWKPEG